jgi:hypothetical protein
MMPDFRVRPMQHRAVFRWTFAASGLWLMLSPFLLFAGEAAKSDLFVGEAGLLMISGFLALVIAGYSCSRHNLMPPYLGLVLGLGVFLAPWLAEFADRLVTWNAAVIGVILSVVAFFEFLHDQPAPSNP